MALKKSWLMNERGDMVGVFKIMLETPFWIVVDVIMITFYSAVLPILDFSALPFGSLIQLLAYLVGPIIILVEILDIITKMRQESYQG